MASADSNILREYLVALGFKVDETEHKKFDGVMLNLDKRATRLAKGIVAVGTSIVTMSHLFAKSMERLFYSARYADTTAKSMQAMEFGAQQIGLKAGQASGALKNMTAAIRSNPGLIGLLNSLGIKVTGRDKAEVMLDLVEALRKMPFYVAQRYAEMFGIDAETLFNMQEGLEKMKQQKELQKQMAEEMGYNADNAAKVGVEYMNMWNQVKERASMFAWVLAEAALPRMREVLGVSNEVLKTWSGIVREIERTGTEDFWKRLREGAMGKAEGGGVVLSEDAKRRLGVSGAAQDTGKPNAGLFGAWQDWRDRRARARAGLPTGTDPAAVSAANAPHPKATPEEYEAWRKSNLLPDGTPAFANTSPRAPQGAPRRDRGERTDGVDPDELFSRLESKYSLPSGLLDKVWKKESARGRKMISPAGAEGHFGFMPKTQDEYGLTDPYNLEESADAAARKWRDLIGRSKGDLREAAGRYNYGESQDRLERIRLGKAPAETQDYMDTIGGQGGAQVSQTTNIHINGVSDPREAGEVVAREQVAVNAELARNFKPKVR